MSLLVMNCRSWPCVKLVDFVDLTTTFAIECVSTLSASVTSPCGAGYSDTGTPDGTLRAEQHFSTQDRFEFLRRPLLGLGTPDSILQAQAPAAPAARPLARAR